MLIEFTVENFLSFRDRHTLSLEATGISEFAETNVVERDRHKLLRGAVVYGANSSGKSNLIAAINTMRRLVLGSAERSSVSELGITPFLLSTVTEGSPAHFEVIFLLDGLRYRYGFEVNNDRVIAEWLFESKKPGGAEFDLFTREADGIAVTPRFKEGKGLESKTRDNALFLSVVDQFAGEKAAAIMQWFGNCVVISALSHQQYEPITVMLLDHDPIRQKMVEFFHSLDLGFQDIEVKKRKFRAADLPDDLPPDLRQELSLKLEGGQHVEVKTKHQKFNAQQEPDEAVFFDMADQESTGTRKLFNLSGPIFDVLHDGGVLVVDEIDASIHPRLMLAITRLFHATESNPNNAQLIITTHDTNLLTYAEYRRDQVYFIEKDPFEASDLYSLVEYKHGDGGAVRKDESFEKNYIQGRYGAIPFVGNPANIIRKWQQNQ